MAQEYGHIRETNIQIDIIAKKIQLNGTGDERTNKSMFKQNINSLK